MCVIYLAFQKHSEYPLILLANRDEFYDRPTAAAEKWEDFPNILAGRDLVHGGTWLGVNDAGRFAAVTNFHQPSAPKGTVSRGNLVADFLKENDSSENYLQEIKQNREKFSGFNLFVGKVNSEKQEVFYYSNRSEDIQKLECGIYGLSNHLLDTAWQKVLKGKSTFSKMLEQNELEEDTMFEILADKIPAEDQDLPDTGIGLEREKILSSIFIETPIYGTRSSTILLIDENGEITFKERIFH